ALEAVILRLLEKSPARRFATAVETAEALRESLAATGTAGDTDSAATVAILDALSRGRLVGRAAEQLEIPTPRRQSRFLTLFLVGGWSGARQSSPRLSNFGAAPARATAMPCF